MTPFVSSSTCVERKTFLHVIEGDDDKDVRFLRRARSLGDLDNTREGSSEQDAQSIWEARDISTSSCSTQAGHATDDIAESSESSSGEVAPQVEQTGEGGDDFQGAVVASSEWSSSGPYLFGDPVWMQVAVCDDGSTAMVYHYCDYWGMYPGASSTWTPQGMYPCSYGESGSSCYPWGPENAGPMSAQPQEGEGDVQSETADTERPPSAKMAGSRSGIAAKVAELDGDIAEAGDDLLAADGCHEQHRDLANEMADDALNVLYLAAQKDVAGEHGVEELVSACLCPLPDLRTPAMMSKLLWSLGKLEVHCAEVSSALRHVATFLEASPEDILMQLRPHELSKALWGLARLAPGRGTSFRAWGKPEEGLALALITEITSRVDALTPQCLSNALWAVARLEVHGPSVHRFVKTCAAAFCGLEDYSGFTSQGLANVLWSFARLCVASRDAGLAYGRSVCKIAVMEAQGRLGEFQPQELSMLAWAVAKLHGRGRTSVRGSRAHAVSTDLVQVLLSVTKIAGQSLQLFTPQGISNIAWSMAKMDMLTHPEVQEFMLAISAWAAPNLHEYPPQAIANLLWAVGQLPPEIEDVDATLTEIAASAARQAYQRMQEFGWQDLAGVAVALSHGRHSIPEALAFMSEAMMQSAWYCSEARVMLNIALAAARLGVTGPEYQDLVEAIRGTWDPSGWSSEDLRQWAKVQQHCLGATSHCGSDCQNVTDVATNLFDYRRWQLVPAS